MVGFWDFSSWEAASGISGRIAFPLGIGLTAIIAGLVIGGPTYFLWKRKHFAWWLILVGLFAFSLATFFDQVGWVDFIVLVITTVPIILLIRDRYWYLQPWEKK